MSCPGGALLISFFTINSGAGESSCFPVPPHISGCPQEKQPLPPQHEQNRFCFLLWGFFLKFCKTGVNIFDTSTLIRGFENKLFVVGVRKLTPCDGIRPCSKEVLALSLAGVWLEACVSHCWKHSHHQGNSMFSRTL